MSRQVPEGYQLMRSGYAFNDAMLPLYLKKSTDGPQFGFFVETNHCNPAGICHGGMLMSLMDIALASGIHHQAGDMKFTPTLNMNFDFIAAGQLGDWLATTVDFVHVTRTVGYANGYVHGPHGIVLRANGSFKLPKNI